MIVFYMAAQSTSGQIHDAIKQYRKVAKFTQLLYPLYSKHKTKPK